jgi:hypothetical protein
MRTAISPKRLVPLNNEYKMIVFHLPPISSIEAVTGQFIFLPDLTIIVTFSLPLILMLPFRNLLQIQTIVSFFA